MVTGSDNELVKKANEIYSRSYWSERNATLAFDSIYSDNESKFLHSKWQSQMEFCKHNLGDKKSLFEIGAGKGQNLYFFKSRGFDVFGLEPDKNNVDKINNLLGSGLCVNGYAETFQTDKKFDIVWMSHVLEHVIDPKIVFKKVYDILNHGGLFFVEVPNCECSKMTYSSFQENPSTFGFTLKSLRHLGMINGFKTIKDGHFITHLTLIDKVLRKLKIQKSRLSYQRTTPDNGFDLRILFIK